jgi:hypothetical protein
MSMHGAIDGNISDLFFNTDLTGAHEECDDDKDFAGYDTNKLREEARMFLACLDRLGVAVPSVDALLEDFNGRL